MGALLTVTFYFLISGASISAQRAYIMSVITLLSYLFDTYFMGLRSIALTAILMICIYPSETTSPSFQMSFATTAALMANVIYGVKEILLILYLKFFQTKG
ncbi:ComEC/Rec2 family competence protein [Candidatus Liberibacter brunswickensis]|uniref:ComEC/Rec2 family competence protein n=1 Tax=Candidatus Liberibacter brunswickensis TaxID=1968796 RepID=UPI002FE3B672